jgi:Dolichyl-phosphate-mannose-protein mannosyltransferase
MLAGQLLPRPQQSAALYLTALTPFFSVLAVTFNANAILLLVWPWTVYAFVRSMESRRTSDAVLFGVLAAVSMLAKYSSILLLATCLAAALLHPGARAYFATKLPRIAVGVAVLFVIPHAVWALSHHLTTVEYVYDKQHPPLGKALQIAASSLLGSLGFLLLALLAFAVMLGRKFRSASIRTAVEALAPRQRWQTVLAAGLPLLTVIFALRFGLKVSTNFLFPTLFMIPIVLLAQSGVLVGQAQLVVLRRFVAGWFVAALALALVFAYAAFAWKTDQTAQPRKEIAEVATAAWRDAFRSSLPVVAGSEPYSVELPFYSSDTPSFYDLTAPAATPWVTPERIARDGILIICVSSDANCLAAAAPLATPATQHHAIRVSHAYFGAKQAELSFELFLTPPKP